MQVQDIIAYTISTTIQLPRTVAATTDPQTMDYATHAYHDAAMSWVAVDGDNSAFPYAALTTIALAMVTGAAVTVLYTHDGDVTARTLFPSSISYTADHKVCVKAFCTLRRETRSFRLDRMTGVHLVTLPGETLAPDADVIRADPEGAQWHADQREMARTPVPAHTSPVDAAGEPLY